MSRVRVRNSFTSKIFMILFIIVFIAAIIFLGYKIIMRDKNNNIFDLGKLDNDVEYTDKIVNSYEEFHELLNKYNVPFNATKEEFDESSFLFLFQDYNTCGESKPKSIEKVSLGESVKVTFRVHSQCGWCEKHLILYILKIDKVEDIKNIDYEYVFPTTQQDCGEVK